MGLKLGPGNPAYSDDVACNGLLDLCLYGSEAELVSLKYSSGTLRVHMCVKRFIVVFDILTISGLRF